MSIDFDTKMRALLREEEKSREDLKVLFEKLGYRL